jgi:hypothetical protein
MSTILFPITLREPREGKTAMKEACHDGQASPARAWSFVGLDGFPLELETSLFVLASALDFLMTWLLLNYQSAGGHIEFVESNFVARYFLYSWGFNGLIGFKFATVAMVAVICQIIARSRIEVARRLLQFATVAAMGVVVYSVVLLFRHT